MASKASRKLLLVSCATIAISVGAQCPALAAETHAYSMGRQDLAEALKKFSEISGTDLIFPPELVRGKISPEISGTYSDEAVLKALLSGTGLSAIKTSGGAMVLRLAPTKISAPGPFPAPIVVAQATPAPAQVVQAAPAEVEEVVVTGSRVVRDGYEAPTPLTVMNVEQINSAAPANIADFVNALPSMAGGLTPHQGGGGVSNQTKGLNTLNLRGLGSNRTLVLLDGQRVPGASLDGSVDISEMPDSLIQRVDVVTGGASAAYGSDALAGVVNFVLDHQFTGLKGLVQGGVTTYGDDRAYKVSLTGGTSFASGRGHVLIYGELGRNDGIFNSPRGWAERGWLIVNNPAYTATNGQPRLLVRPEAAPIGTPGGIIISGPLKGVAFGPGGTPFQLNYGSLVADPLMVGGDWKYNLVANATNLDQRMSRQSLFTRASYQLTDSLEVFALASYAIGDGLAVCCYQFNLGNLPAIKADNAFIPASVSARMTALGITTLAMSSMDRDLGLIWSSNIRSMNRYMVGGNGKFDAFESVWSWDAYLQKGVARSTISLPRISITANFNAAMDAVRAPNGAIVCRSSLTNPTNGCVPYNVFGVGVNSQAALNYVQGDSHLYQNITQDMAGATVRGEPFSDWAGPVSLAVGVEHRKEQVKGRADPLSLASAYFAGNYKPTFGSYSVTEGFAETVVPLAKDTVWARALDLNAAIRLTDYSTSGFVTTWKVGTTYSPIDDIRFRATRSRDIRAPNLQDAFLAGTLGTAAVLDPFRNGISNQQQSLVIGNPNLKPEKADTVGVGIVLQPRFFSGFSASVDYYSIKISDAIASISAQNIVDRCYAGNQSVCGAIARDANGVITIITQQPFNLVSERTRGLDIEASYRLRLDEISPNLGGNITLRALGTHVITRTTNDGTTVLEAAGSNSGSGPASWRWLASAGYSDELIDLTLTGRAVSSGVYNNAYIACTTGCPTSTAARQTIDNNHIDGAFYLDAAFTYKLAVEDVNTEVFLSIQNLTNKDPVAVAATGGNNYLTMPANPSLYDTLGRQFRAGVRFKM